MAFVFFTLALPDQANVIFQSMFEFTTRNFDWFLIGAADLVVLFVLFLIVTPYGGVRLSGSATVRDYAYLGMAATIFH